MTETLERVKPRLMVSLRTHPLGVRLLPGRRHGDRQRLARGRRLPARQSSRADPDLRAFAVAALDAGVDMTDPDEVERFVRRYNEGLAA
jgi:hypothetical protein